MKVHREHQKAEHPKLSSHHVQPALDEKKKSTDEIKAISKQFDDLINEIKFDEESIETSIHHNMFLLASGFEVKDKATVQTELQQTIETELCSPVAAVMWNHVADADHQMKVIAHSQSHGVSFEHVFKPTLTVSAPTFEQAFRAEFKLDHSSAEHEVIKAEHHFYLKYSSQYIKSVLKQIVGQELIIQQHMDVALKMAGQTEGIIDEPRELQAALTMMRDVIENEFERLNEEAIYPLIINQEHMAI